MIQKKHFRLALFAIFAIVLLFGAGSRSLQAQVAPSGYSRPFSVTVGGIASAFNPDYVQTKLGGVGAFVDVNLFHGVGVEAEGRWLRFHEVEGINQDNYLIGPKVKIFHFWRANPYVKALGGISHMNFEDNSGTGRFGVIAMGGGIDIHLTRRWSVRAIDAEYQEWPKFLGDSLSPYGISTGISYRIF